MNIHPSKKAELIFVTKDYEEDIKESKEFLLKLGFGKEIKIQKDKSGIESNAISIISNGIELSCYDRKKANGMASGRFGLLFFFGYRQCCSRSSIKNGSSVLRESRGV